jgi:hypothetical protein
MTVAYVLPFDLEEELGELTGDLATFQKLRRNRDGQMPVGRDRARHRSSRRSQPWHSRRESAQRRSDK